MEVTPNGIKRGMELEDAVTGIKGFCVGFIELMDGSIQVGINTRSKDGIETPKSHFLDYHTLKITDEVGITNLMKQVEPLLDFNIGDKAKDKVSGLEGILTERYTAQNGCVLYTITPKTNYAKGDPVAVMFSQHRLEKIQENAVPLVTKSLGGAPSSVLPMRG